LSRVSILIGTLLAMAALSAEAATRSTVIEARIVLVDTCSAAFQPAAQGEARVSCERGTPYRVDQPAPQVQTSSTAAARTVTVTY
jgi:hypothetical protein